jgi:carboxylesterase type B
LQINFLTLFQKGAENTTGASHCSEVVYFFGTLYMDPATAYTDDDHTIADTMSSYVANFVANQNPNGAGMSEWPRVVAGQPFVFQVGNNYTQIPIADPLASKLDFLQRFYATQRVW